MHLAKIVYITTAPLHKFNLPVAADERGEYCKCLGLRFVESQQMLSSLNTMLLSRTLHDVNGYGLDDCSSHECVPLFRAQNKEAIAAL